MAETSVFRQENHVMRTVYRAGGFGRLVYSEGEYYHYCPKPIPSYKEWLGRSGKYADVQVHSVMAAPLLIGRRLVGAIARGIEARKRAT